MATYTFETMSDTDAAHYTLNDNLVFQTDSVSALSITDNPSVVTSGPLGTSTSVESITISDGTHSHTFSAAELSAASEGGNVLFLNGDNLVVGTGAADGALTPTDAGHGHSTVVYGFGGADVIDVSGSHANDTVAGGDGNDSITGGSSYTDANGNFTESDFLQGGAGNDLINGGVGNDHIYGNMFSTTAGTDDGNDTIHAGIGNDYVNGNAGNDSITGDDGQDRLYGGNGNDTVSGGEGNDYLQGNKGNDVLDGGNGSDTIHGGAGHDTITADSLGGGNAADDLWGDAGNDTIVGANGNDTIHGGADYDNLTGGGGNDVFAFATGDASDHWLNTTGAAHGTTDVITDFNADGTDHISLGFTVSAVLHAQAGLTFVDSSAAETYAQTLLAASTGTHGTEVAAIDVGGDTYLFWDDTHSSAAANSVVELTGVTASDIAGNGADFV
jgi:serralysin